MRLTIKATQINKDRKRDERNRWDILYGDTVVGHIVCLKSKVLDIASDLHLSSMRDTEPSKKYSTEDRIWNVFLCRGYDPCSYPHTKKENMAYVDVLEGKLQLICPYLVTVDEARLWVKKHFDREMLQDF